MSDETWRQSANCATTDPDMFFPEKGGSVREPLAVCNACNVKAQCLQWALDNDERTGILGGTVPSQRRAMKRRLGRTAA